MLQITRSYGLLEKFLSDMRINKAKGLMKQDNIDYNRILDIGSGFYPNLLIKTDFNEKYGIESTDIDISAYRKNKIKYYKIDLEKKVKMPFKNNYLDCVTMLAVFEHLLPSKLPDIINEIHRVLKKGGLFILTTPAKWTENLLKFLSVIRVVSDVEINDHKDQYTVKKIFTIFKNTKFNIQKMQGGYFEAFMNIWIKAVK